jgi:hypothetical protein
MLMWNMLCGMALVACAWWYVLNASWMKWQHYLLLWAVIIGVLWASDRYKYEDVADSKAAYIVDSWEAERIGVLFQAPSEPFDADRQ